MKYTNLSYQAAIEKILSAYPHFKIVEKQDEPVAHDILEAEGMQLLKDVRLTYSRRPDLWQSFNDSNQKALVFFEPDRRTTIAALSESENYYLREKIVSYYSSDLRVSPRASLRVRKDFREIYQKFIAALPSDAICTTAILKDNLKAMNAFTRGSTNLFYNEMFEYLIRTIVLLPSLFFHHKPLFKKYELLSLHDHPEREEELNAFIKNFEKEADFSNNILKSRLAKKNREDEFFIVKDDMIAGYFSLLRPTSRSIFVQTTSLWVRILLKVLSLFSPTDLSVKLPWVYLTSMVLSEDLKAQPDLLSTLIMELRRFKRLKIGELLLIIHPKNGAYAEEKAEANFFLRCPQIVNTGILFRVESEKKDRSITGNIHIDPSEL